MNMRFIMRSRRIIALAVSVVMSLVAVPLVAYGQYSFNHVDYNVGLSSSNVKCIAEDSYGFIWLGTKNGLHRYDGMSTRRFNCFDYVKRRGNNNIGAIYEDGGKKLWVGTDRGIYLYDPVTDLFSYMDTRDDRTGQSATNWVQAIAGDGKGSVWALLPDQGVFRYHDGKVDFFRVLPANINLKDTHISDMCVDRNGNVWIVTNGAGAYKFDRRANRFGKIKPAGGDTMDGMLFITVAEDTDGTIVLATSEGHLLRYEPARNTLTGIPFIGGGKIYLRCITCFDDEIWIGSQDGLYVLNKVSGQTAVLRHDPLNPFSLSDNIIYYLYKSRSGDAWVGTTYGGADYMSHEEFRFDVYGLWSGLAGRIVIGMAQGPDNRIWIGTEDKGLFTLNPSTGVVTPVSGVPPLCVSTLFLTRFNGSVYAGFTRGGLIKIDSDGRFSSVLDISEADNSVYSYIKDSRGNEWVGLGYALYRRNAGSAEFVHVSETGFCWIFNMFEAHDGTIWIATMGNGVWKYNPSTGKFKCYQYNDDVGCGLRSNNISSVMEDSRGRIWISTDRGGISRYNSKQDNFTSFGIEEGLPDDVAYNILEDMEGNLWFGTNKGLVKFNPDTHAVRVFTVRDGLPNNEFTYNSAIKGNDGRFYFGGIGGVTVFNPDNEDMRPAPVSVYFTQLRIFGREVTVDSDNSPLKRNIMFTDRLTLPYDMATFSLDVVAPAFGITGGNEYSYRLEPSSSGWVRMSDNRISFVNLSPGEYKLSVKVENHGRTSQKDIEIIISPPWWRSVWAYLVYIILAALAVWRWFIWYRAHKEKQLREQNRLFEISKEKELYQNKVNFFTEVAHEIRTPLSLIAAPLEAIEEDGISGRRAQHYLKVIRQNTKRLLNLTGQLLDFQKIGSNRLTLKNENVDIRALLDETVYRFEPAYTLKGKELQKQIGDGPLIASTDKEAVTKILSNLFNNALKYARHTARVVLTADGQNFIIKVTSDGAKITGDERKRIFEPFYQADKANSGENGVGMGLPLSSSLAKLLGGSLTLDDDDSDGNTFTATIPLNKAGIQKNNEHTVDSPDYVLDDDSNQSKERAVGYTVLIVEDNDSMREFLAEQANMSFSIETARNGREALDKLAESHVDLIVTDIMMPEMDGFELCRTVKADINMSHIPIVFITAKNDLDSKLKGLQLGAEAYIEKPFSIKYFRQLISSLLDNRRRERESFSKKPFFNVDNMRMTKADEDFMNKVMKIIEDNIGEDDFNVETMADILCMSHSSLLRKIRSVFNMSPVELIRTVKLKKAAELIQEGKHLIGDICYMVGIASPSYFSKLFFKQFGISPKDFEKQCRERKP